MMKHHRLDRDINLCTSRGDGNLKDFWRSDFAPSDINLFTSRGDGNAKTPSTASLNSDINLFTSRGDGNL